MRIEVGKRNLLFLSFTAVSNDDDLVDLLYSFVFRFNCGVINVCLSSPLHSITLKIVTIYIFVFSLQGREQLLLSNRTTYLMCTYCVIVIVIIFIFCFEHDFHKIRRHHFVHFVYLRGIRLAMTFAFIFTRFTEGYVFHVFVLMIYLLFPWWNVVVSWEMFIHLSI